MLDIRVSNFYTLVPSKTRGFAFKISYARPKTGLRQRFFVPRAGSAYLKLRFVDYPSLTNFGKFKRAARKALLSYE